ncbi:MAG: pantoate--beta-alanine ligase [Acidobacteria bacterium]|nr:pantoate--beta-alanine ligase [Acidobacteriota bacterium]
MAGGTVGLVPTMGYFHAGHHSLMTRSVRDNELTMVTIFVNPLQFAPDEDLETYPRDLERDLEMCVDAGVSLVLNPTVEEMYPSPVLTTVSVSEIGAHLEGRSRPTHFDGVATVVAKLFALTGPCRAYFSEKDFQQLAIVKTMASDLSFPVEVVDCPIVREPDGVAMSSRNSYLSPQQRDAATVLYRALLAAAALVDDGETDPAAVRSAMVEALDAEPLATLDYAEVIDPSTLRVPEIIDEQVRLVISADLGPARLLDNIAAVPPQPVGTAR